MFNGAIKTPGKFETYVTNEFIRAFPYKTYQGLFTWEPFLFLIRRAFIWSRKPCSRELCVKKSQGPVSI